ncbi:MAG: preprotein translocase subunit Sec61beta [Nanoarchaeota archaeon]|nr:preprotein translocase subunit Sec61beta [Nanoarchaeota archaeon]
MAEDNRIRLPSGQGGLTRYFDEYHSKVSFSPGTVIIMVLVVMVLIILLHSLGGSFLE